MNRYIILAWLTISSAFCPYFKIVSTECFCGLTQEEYALLLKQMEQERLNQPQVTPKYEIIDEIKKCQNKQIDQSKLRSAIAKYSRSDLLNVDGLGNSALHLASYLGCNELFKFLWTQKINKFNDIYVKNNFGDTPLSLAIQKGHNELAQKIISSSNFNRNSLLETTSTRLNNNVYLGNLAQILKKIKINGKEFPFETKLVQYLDHTMKNDVGILTLVLVDLFKTKPTRLNKFFHKLVSTAISMNSENCYILSDFFTNPRSSFEAQMNFIHFLMENYPQSELNISHFHLSKKLTLVHWMVLNSWVKNSFIISFLENFDDPNPLNLEGVSLLNFISFHSNRRPVAKFITNSSSIRIDVPGSLTD